LLFLSMQLSYKILIIGIGSLMAGVLELLSMMYFYSDVFQICSAFIIFLLIGIIIYYLKIRFTDAAQIQ
jgi:hypothetical protein